jgi:4-diphosphocytidyl-2-C-methyl-D-erythritol kinase
MLVLFSPAKINLFLHILEKRADNYHALSSILQTIGLGDILEVQLHNENVLTCTDPSLRVDVSNLIVQAVKLFKEKTKFKNYFMGM